MKRKFTDNEIVKALEICSKNIVTRHNGLTYEGIPLRFLFEDALDLINRQKAEIDRLTVENKLLIENAVSNKYPNCVLVEKGRIYTRTLEDYDELIGDISAEAIKEFAERLKSKASGIRVGGHEFVTVEGIDNLVKEMVGE